MIVITTPTGHIGRQVLGNILDDSWSGQGSVPVLGPEDLSCNDMARIMSEVLGKPGQRRAAHAAVDYPDHVPPVVRRST